MLDRKIEKEMGMHGFSYVEAQRDETGRATHHTSSLFPHYTGAIAFSFCSKSCFSMALLVCVACSRFSFASVLHARNWPCPEESAGED
jgi:hypothetical protein